MENYEDIDIKRILGIIFSKKLIIALIILLSITLGYVYSYYYKTPEYKSSVKILLVADESKVNKELTQTDLSINSSLISTYSSIAKSTNVIQNAIENLNLDISVANLQKNIEVTPIDKTQFLKITVQNENPEVAKNIANEIAKVFTAKIKEIYNLDNISIVDEAEIASQPCNVNHKKDLIMFAAVGVFLSAILVIAVYIFDDTIKDEKDIERNIKLKNIGTLPLDKDNNELIIKNNPKSHIVESIKTLRTNILYTTNKKAILITSSRPKEGKSWIINNLAVAFAQTDKKVILVDTDLRKENNRNEIFGVEKGEGLSDFIREISDDKLENLEKSKKYIKETKIDNLHILQNGTIPPNPSELITSENMKKLLDLLKCMYDVVLLDGTSCMIVSDSIALSSMVDGTILVSESKKTKINDLKKTKKLIEEVNGKILGVISNKAEIQKGKYYGKKYGYYYGSETKESEKIENVETDKRKNSLEEIIEIAKQKIEKEDLINDETVEIEENNELQENINESNDEINKEIKSVRKEILGELGKLKHVFTELKKDSTKKQIENINSDINSMKNLQDSNNEQLNNLKEMQNSNNEQLNNLKEMQNSNNEQLNSLKEMQNNNNEQLIEKIEKIKENQNNSKKELLDIIENMNYQEDIRDINGKISSNKEEYAKMAEEINSIKDIQNSNQKELLDIIENMNYQEDIKNIHSKISSNKEEYENAVKEINDKLLSNKEEYENTVNSINDKLISNKEEYENTVSNINDKLLNNKEEYVKMIEEIKEKDNENLAMIIQQFISEINNLKGEINSLKDIQDSNNSKILEKIENMNYDEKLTEINNKIQNNENNTSNIISFESLKERKKSNKKVFKINEVIHYSDLERLSTCVIDLNEDMTAAEAMSN